MSPCVASLACGGGGIRTPGTPKGTTVFETAPINHSGTPPRQNIEYNLLSIPTATPALQRLPEDIGRRRRRTSEQKRSNRPRNERMRCSRHLTDEACVRAFFERIADDDEARPRFHSPRNIHRSAQAAANDQRCRADGRNLVHHINRDRLFSARSSVSEEQLHSHHFRGERSSHGHVGFRSWQRHRSADVLRRCDASRLHEHVSR